MAKAFTLYSTKWYASAFALRQRMLNFVQNFEYYMMFEVVEPHWHVFESNMNEVLTFYKLNCHKKTVSALFIISLYWDSADTWNLTLWMSGTHLSGHTLYDFFVWLKSVKESYDVLS